MRIKMPVWANDEERARAAQVVMKVICRELSPKVVQKISERLDDERVGGVPVPEVQRKALLLEQSFTSGFSLDTPRENTIDTLDLRRIWITYDEILDLDHVDFDTLSETLGISTEELRLVGMKVFLDLHKFSGEPRSY